jgi:formylglycine-generating enzyme required for sulfatase activity
MRLCTAQEWESACQGGERSRWPYGNHYKAEICNLRGDSVEVTGARNKCRSTFAIFDMSGNIAEWVAEGGIRGGSALDRTRGQCSLKRANPDEQSAFSDVGFRCCADAIASPPPSD